MENQVYVTDVSREKVKVYDIEPFLMIVAEEGWTDDDWETSVPLEIVYRHIGYWDYYSTVEDDGSTTEIWLVDKG